MDGLASQGFVLWTDCAVENTIRYDEARDSLDLRSVRRFIDGSFLPYVRSELHLPELSEIGYGKFRFSNKTNGSDAATFHSDLYNCTDEVMPVYTCLFYFDEAQMELIPRSHLPEQRAYSRVMQNYSRRVRLRVPKNSVLVFNSALLHRGVGYGTVPRRRLLQVFECEFDGARTDKILVVDTRRFNLSTNLTVAAGEMPAVVFVHFLIVYFDLQYKLALADLPPWTKSGRYVGYVPGKTVPYSDTAMESNVNVVVNNNVETVQSSNFYGVVLLFTLWVLAKQVR